MCGGVWVVWAGCAGWAGWRDGLAVSTFPAPLVRAGYFAIALLAVLVACVRAISQTQRQFQRALPLQSRARSSVHSLRSCEHLSGDCRARRSVVFSLGVHLVLNNLLVAAG